MEERKLGSNREAGGDISSLGCTLSFSVRRQKNFKKLIQNKKRTAMFPTRVEQTHPLFQSTMSCPPTSLSLNVECTEVRPETATNHPGHG